MRFLPSSVALAVVTVALIVAYTSSGRLSALFCGIALGIAGMWLVIFIFWYTKGWEKYEEDDKEDDDS